MPTVLVAFLNVHNNVALGSINFLCTQNTFFIFLAPNMVYFVKHLPKICFKNGPTQFYKILYHILCTIHQLFASKKFSRLPSRNRQICANSAGSGSNLYYKYFIVFSYFFCILFSYFKDLKLNQEKETKKKQVGRLGVAQASPRTRARARLGVPGVHASPHVLLLIWRPKSS
jgi:hypothetical protein